MFWVAMMHYPLMISKGLLLFLDKEPWVPGPLSNLHTPSLLLGLPIWIMSICEMGLCVVVYASQLNIQVKSYLHQTVTGFSVTQLCRAVWIMLLYWSGNPVSSHLTSPVYVEIYMNRNRHGDFSMLNQRRCKDKGKGKQYLGLVRCCGSLATWVQFPEPT